MTEASRNWRLSFRLVKIEGDQCPTTGHSGTTIKTHLNEKLSIRQQCVLLGLCRTSLYYTASEETAENLEIMQLLDRQYAITPFYGQRRLQAWLAEMGYPVNIKRLRRLMGLARWRTLFPEHRTTVADKKAYKYPYLLKGLDIDHRNQVWELDISYIPMRRGAQGSLRAPRMP